MNSINQECLICQGFGFAHPLKENGKVDYSSLVYCKCRDKAGQVYTSAVNNDEAQQDGQRRALQPDDIDFPVSYDYYRSLCRLHSWNDPGTDRPIEVEAPVPAEVIHRHSDMSQQEFARLRALEGEVKYLRGKVGKREEDTY